MRADLNENRISVLVSGMDCVSCARIIRRNVSKIRGVKEVRAAVVLNKVLIDYDPKDTDLVAVRNAVARAGFKTISIYGDGVRRSL